MSTTRVERSRRRGGFTLMEVMVVVIILGILAATILPQFIGTTQEAKIAAARADIKTLQGALERFYLHMDRYPTTEEGLKALVNRPSDGAGWRGPYIDALKPDPWKVPYNYRVPGTRGVKSYDLWSRGADKADGGEGDNGDIGNWPDEGAGGPGGR